MQGRKRAVVTSGRGAATLLVQVEKKAAAKSFGRDGGIGRGKKKHSSAGVIGSGGCVEAQPRQRKEEEEDEGNDKGSDGHWLWSCRGRQ
ncbi:hypothetical protein BHM03_00051182 [Ensete ventricosum]|nr:hypothetical protein BHM03_00051182 [Ensete ventricosum]